MRSILILALTALCAAAAEKRPITETDLYAFKWVADPNISPDGSQVAYTLVTVTPKHDNYLTSLWIVPTAGGAPRQLSSGTHDSAPRWSPDGARLAFLRAGEKDGRPDPAQIYILDIRGGGEARALTDLPKGASSPVWSPDGHSIAFMSSTEPSDSDKKKDEEKSDVRVINRAVYRSNGAGYRDYERVSHIFTAEVPAILSAPAKARQITKDRFDEGSLTWSRDGAQLYFTSEREPEPYYERPHTDLYAIDAKGGEMRKVVTFNGSMHGLALSPDGKSIAFAGTQNGPKVLSYQQPDLFVSDLTPGATPKCLTTDYDYDIGGGVGGDQAPPRASAPSLPYWSKDGRYIYVTAAEKGRGNLKRIEARSGKVESVTTGDWDVFSYNATPDRSSTALAISTSTNIGDIYVIDAKSSTPRQITRVNEELFSQLDIAPAEEVLYKSFDGRTIQGLVAKPPHFDASKKYPLILNIHGGPHSTYGFNFFHEMQWMAAKGYVVLYPNPRGSTSFGQDFGNVIQYHYPGDDYKDLMAGVDALIAKGYVDPGHLGVTGGSGGGVLTNWVVGHTNRFKAAVSQRSIADWGDWWYTADFTQFQPSWFRGAPFEDSEDFKARSPITYIKNVETPLMLIEGEQDFRCPPGAGGEQMFRALKYLHKTAVMVQFPGESHELSRSGRPRHRIERLEHIVNWFDIYLQGKPNQTYAISEE